MYSSFVRSGPLERDRPERLPWLVVWFSLSVVVLWAVWAAEFNSAQFGDNIEQFNWAQSLELGYHKHPPLPSWALGGVVRLFGPSIYWAYLLATLCLLGTAIFTWLVARRLIGERAAAAAVVLWGLSLSFSQRAQLYNHNTVLVLWVSATVWLAMRAASAERARRGWWVATGMAAAAAVLSKYQALVPLAGLLLALGLSGSLARRADRQGVWLAIFVAAALCTPHAVWVVHHDFSTLHYAADAVEASSFPQRLGFIVSFIVNQLRIESPALLAMALCIGLARFWPVRVESSRPARPLSHAAPAGRERAMARWMFGLIGIGLLVLVVMALASGVSLRNHWGVQALQFLPIWLAWQWDRRAAIDLRRLVGVALLVHGAGLVDYAYEHRRPMALASSRRIDTMYPARRLARAAVRHWTDLTDCPMHYVAGTVFDSGLVSLYSGGNLAVFDTASATPWVRPEDLQREGALYVLDGDDPVPPGVGHVMRFDLLPAGSAAEKARTIRIGILMPQIPCSE